MYDVKQERSFSWLLLIVLLILLPGCNIAGKPKNKPAPANTPRLVIHTEYLDEIVLENSGLIWYRDKLWTINDSGGDPVLFSIDMRTGKCIQAIYIEGAYNRDWEELAQDEDFIYILDTGNNYGRRDELTVYKVTKDSIPVAGNARVNADIIRYRYGDMEKNRGYFTRSPYDCEAAFALHDSLYLFTKDWENRQTDLYTCSASPGTYTLWPVATFEADGLVTGADISPDSSLVMLVGYKDYVPFVWEIRGFNFSDYSMESTKRIDFPEKYDLQTEGIAIQADERIYVSCEMSSWPASVYTLNLGDHVRRMP
ncbi:MAG: hypothetical protein AMS23_11090 [Bacteroides sp. SM1_62]|nr:MAG: hypothetical protein AMS23_11090 [Bacteroides sp. SM1_62]